MARSISYIHQRVWTYRQLQLRLAAGCGTIIAHSPLQVFGIPNFGFYIQSIWWSKVGSKKLTIERGAAAAAVVVSSTNVGVQ